MERLQLSEAVERLERLERDSFLVSAVIERMERTAVLIHGQAIRTIAEKARLKTSPVPPVNRISQLLRPDPAP